MALFALEHKRLWRSVRVWMCVAVCFLYSVVWGGLFRYQCFAFGSPGDPTRGTYGNRFDGYAAIRDYREQAAGYGGVWTDETLQKMVRDFRAAYPEVHLQSGADWVLASYFLSQLYPELKDPAQRYIPLILYADTEKLTGFYERRQDLLETALEEARQEGALTQADVEMLLDMDSRIETPWPYGWVHGWDTVTGYLPGVFSRLAPYLAVVLAFTFSGEWRDKTAPLLHTTRYGRRRLARVKLLSGLTFAAELYALTAGCHIILQLIYLGTEGWDLPIQFTSLLAVAPWNMLQAELYELALGLLGVLGYAALVLLLSALVKNSVLSLALSLAYIYMPDLLERWLPGRLSALTQCLPLMGGSGGVFSYDVFHLFGRGVWSAYILMAAPVLTAAVCLPLAVWCWSRRRGS